MECASFIFEWLYGYATQRLVTGSQCPLSENPTHAENVFLDINKDMLLAVAELLRNDTAVGILHSIKLPEKTQFHLPPHDGKCITTHMAVLCLLMHLGTRIGVC
jgi:hypothetical protein